MKGKGSEKDEEEEERERERERGRVTAWRERKRGGENVIDIVNRGWKIEKGKEGISEREDRILQGKN